YERVAREGPARDYAYLLKHAAVAIRAANPRARIVSPALQPEDAGWLQDLYDQDAAPYLDVLAALDLASLGSVVDLRDRLDANASVWVVGATIDPVTPRSSALRAYVEARAGGAETVLFAPPIPPALPDFLAEMRSLFPPTLQPAASAALPFDPAAATLSPAAASDVRVTGLY